MACKHEWIIHQSVAGCQHGFGKGACCCNCPPGTPVLDNRWERVCFNCGLEEELGVDGDGNWYHREKTEEPYTNPPWGFAFRGV